MHRQSNMGVDFSLNRTLEAQKRCPIIQEGIDRLGSHTMIMHLQ